MHIKTKSAVKLLNKWKTSYFETRMKIEISAKGHRWEFDKRKLFAETDYIASVVTSLNNVASVSCNNFLLSIQYINN